MNRHLVDSWGKGYRCLYFQLLNFHWYLYVRHRHTDLDQITNMLDTTEQKDLWTRPEWYWFSGFGRKLLRGCQQAVKKSEQWAAFPRGAQTSFLFWSIWTGGSPTFDEVDFEHHLGKKKNEANDEMLSNLWKIFPGENTLLPTKIKEKVDEGQP